ncbi:MAG: hypothetical protein M3295_09720 [Chloroflexota bacterium]|nr:hypothetical protein [Chloroflexota bacterium]
MPVHPRLVGFPRIGPQRELKWALEKAWSGRMSRADFDARTTELRRAHLDEQRSLVGSAVDDYFLYDEVLETAMMFGLVPERVAGGLDGDAFGVLTELARGTPEYEAWEMTKWFDTNYHYVVPEIETSPARFAPLPWRQPSDDADTAWAVLGPYTLVKLSKLGRGVAAGELATALGRAFWAWAAERSELRLQLDEPSLGLAMTDDDRALLQAAYASAPAGRAAASIVTVQFGHASAETVELLGRQGLAVQLPLAAARAMATETAWSVQPEHVVSVMDGRSVWPDPFEPVSDALADLTADGKLLHVVPSTSLMFVPYTVEGEDLTGTFWFAREKARALREWADALNAGSRPHSPELPAVEWPEPGELVPRVPRPERRAAQMDLRLPPYPSTTTGSLPQTGEVRSLRVRLDRGEIDRATYLAEMDRLITEGVRWQERIGLDVLVHGEFERTDMVEYFATKMDGYLPTKHGWVLSYGSRCVRPPILAAPPRITEPMTVREWQVAQAATEKPVKGMLTGPVTIVNWSFRPPAVPDDRLFWAVAQPIAQEVEYLVEAGCRVIQIDEPAVRERWPLPTIDAEERRATYARGVRAALNHVFNAPAPVQMHTHMCYGDFGDIVPLWSDAGVDVASIEFSRSKDDSYIRQFYELFTDGHLQIGPGVFDVHSPYSPGEETMEERLEHFRSFMDPRDLWVNPDCGLKTRRWEEIEVQLADMVGAANREREAERVPA